MKNITTAIALITSTLFSVNAFSAQTQSEIKAQLKNEITAQIKTVIALQLNDTFKAQTIAPKVTFEKVNTQWALAKNTVLKAPVKTTELSE